MKKAPKSQVPANVRTAMRQFDREVAQQSLLATSFLGPVDKPVPFTIKFEKSELDFEFGARAAFRMGTAEHPYELTDLADPKRSYSAAVTWLWACLCEDSAEAFPEPADLSAVIPINRISECAKVFVQAVKDHTAARKESEKPEAK
jgi:hypothetical protein